VTINRTWKAGDKVTISMPMSFRAVSTIDNHSVQSIFFGPTLLTVQASSLVAQAGQAGQSAAAASPEVVAAQNAALAAANLEAGLIKVSLYKHYKLRGDFASAMTPVADKPLHFTFNGQTLAPMFVADPQAGQTLPYHMYVRRDEPTIVFGTTDTGIANARRADGISLLDAVWKAAPFANHARFVAAVERVSTEWRTAGLISAADQVQVAKAARGSVKDIA
jgi:hypothetical protein